MKFTLAQISDPHLGAGIPLFRANFDRVLAAMTARDPALVVISGDVSLDGAGGDTDLAFAAEQFARIGAPFHVIPGNHDVGDHPERMPKQPVDDERLERFRRHMGADRWVIDQGHWRLIGLNSQIMGTHAEQEAQAAMIADALEDLGNRRIAVFSHKPLFTVDPDETEFDYWAVPPFGREPIRALLAHPQLRLVASGHLHLHHEFARAPARYVWAPPVSFIVSPDEQPDLPGTRPTGFVLHHFGDDSVTTELVVPDGMERPYIHTLGLYG